LSQEEERTCRTTGAISSRKAGFRFPKDMTRIVAGLLGWIHHLEAV